MTNSTLLFLLIIISLSIILTGFIIPVAQTNEINKELELHYNFQWDINLDHDKRLNNLQTNRHIQDIILTAQNELNYQIDERLIKLESKP